MPQRTSRPFQARRALLRHVAPRYQQASPAQQTLLLDRFVEWTGYTRKYAIELLNHGEHGQQTIQRHRLPQYGPALQRALFLAWKATHYVCAKRLLPSLPRLVSLLEQHGRLCLTEEERRQVLAMSVSTMDTDSGSELLNEELIAYCEQEHLTFTRGRPAGKNDQCHVEQKNGAVVREAAGHARLVGVQAYYQLREVYRALRLVVNCFQPPLKLQATVPKGEQVHRELDPIWWKGKMEQFPRR